MTAQGGSSILILLINIVHVCSLGYNNLNGEMMLLVFFNIL